MRNFIIYFLFIGFVAACSDNLPVIDKSYHQRKDHVEDFSEIKEAFFPDLDSSILVDSLHINAVDTLYPDSQDVEKILQYLLSRDTLGTASELTQIGRKTLYANVHCTASIEGVDLKGEWFENFFSIDRGWSKNGYNVLVELDGTPYVMEPYNLDGYTTWDEVSYGVRGRNSVSINIAYVGGVDRNMKPKDTRTNAQKRTIDRLLYEIKCAMPDIVIQGHRDNPNVPKACPSYEVSPEYSDLRI